MTNNTQIVFLHLVVIKVDPACQARASLNDTTVDEYAEIMRDESDDNFPPIVVFHDGTDHWLSDGFHRHAAAQKAGLHSLKAEIRQGSRRDAILHAVGANATHGLRRTRDDKRRAVSILLGDPEWSEWSNRKIADCCGVDEKLVRTLRSASAAKPQIARKFERNGTVSEMDTGRIGKKDGLEELLSIEPDQDEEPPQRWLVAPESPAADRSATKPNRDERQPAPNPASSDEGQLQELMSAWDRAPQGVRQQFITYIGVSPTPTAEAGPAFPEPGPSHDPGLSEEPSPIEPQANPLFEIWKGLRGHTSWYGRRWLEIGCPDGALPDEHWTFTEKLVSFRDAARAATEAQRQRFLELSRAA